MRPRSREGIGLIPEEKRGGANQNKTIKRSKSVRCRVCPQRVPVIAAREGDPFCSSDCARKFYGVDETGRRGGVCSGCGVDWGSRTPGCRPCRRRAGENV